MKKYFYMVLVLLSTASCNGSNASGTLDVEVTLPNSISNGRESYDINSCKMAISYNNINGNDCMEVSQISSNKCHISIKSLQKNYGHFCFIHERDTFGFYPIIIEDGTLEIQYFEDKSYYATGTESYKILSDFMHDERWSNNDMLSILNSSYEEDDKTLNMVREHCQKYMNKYPNSLASPLIAIVDISISALTNDGYDHSLYSVCNNYPEPVANSRLLQKCKNAGDISGPVILTTWRILQSSLRQ